MVWCGDNHLLLNVTKTKLNTISIQVEVVEGYKYLGVHLVNTLDWKCNIEAA